jgi:DNA-binding CsgD family transcriptional regulator
MDLFVYGSSPDNYDSINFYVNNIELLEDFKFYFKDKASKLIEKSNKNRVILPEKIQPKLGKVAVENLQAKNNKFQANRYHIPSKYTDVFITHRELEVIRCFSLGCSAKEAALVLGLSPRTIEDHFSNVKLKLRLNRKSSIISKLSDLNLL